MIPTTRFNYDWFYSLPLVGILRGFDRAQVEQIVHASIRGGLLHLEITMNTPDAAGLIRLARELANGHMNIGAGTVLNLQDLQSALDAGASFIVTPILNESVITKCKTQGIPVFPGALSPTEIVTAWELGATMVKVFPADQLGPSYLKNIKAPLPHIKLMPTGGVNLETLPEYAKVADGFGIGSPLFNTERVRASDWDWVETQCRNFVTALSR